MKLWAAPTTTGSTMLNKVPSSLGRLAQYVSPNHPKSKAKAKTTLESAAPSHQRFAPLILLAVMALLALGFWASPAARYATLLGSLCSVLFLPVSESLEGRLTYVSGFLLFFNFVAFWLGPIVVQGAVFKLILLVPAQRIFRFLDESKAMRAFAGRFVYSREKHSDFFVTQLLFLLSAFAGLGVVLYWHLKYGTLPWWLLVAYNFCWVGIGGRGMGSAYAMSHKEGHLKSLYRPWIKRTVGNFFENWVGLIYGNVPYNFTTTHISIHHRLNAGRGDTLYTWDFDRGSVPRFMQYLTRGFLHMSGFGGLRQFYLSPRSKDTGYCFRKLATGCVVYWLVLPAAVIPTLGFSFYFWVILQPLLCMTFFISLINIGFHAFVERDTTTGKHINCVASTTLIGGLDDYFGEDDHMAHHNYVTVYYKDLPAHQRTQRDIWAKRKASVFQGLDIFSFSIFVVMKAWPVIATRFMDFSGEMSQEEVAKMLEERSLRGETRYAGILPEIPWEEEMKSTVEGPGEKALLSRIFPGFDDTARKLQLLICQKMDEGAPPVRDIKTLL